MHHLGGNGADVIHAALPVGNPGRIAQIEAAGMGIGLVHATQHGEPPQAAIEQAHQQAAWGMGDGWDLALWGCHHWA
jgi:hypothetical protein